MKKQLSQLFLSAKQIRKLTILELLYRERRLTLSHLAALLHTSLRTTKNLINEVTRELTEKFAAAPLGFENNSYLFQTDTPADRYFHWTEQLERDYYADSPTLMVFQEIIELRRVSIYDLAVKINYSISHTYHLVKKINDFLRAFHYDVFITEHDYTVAVTGSELEIRLLNYYIYINVFDPAQWPFKSLREPALPRSSREKCPALPATISPAMAHRLTIFLTVWQIAYNHQCYLAAPAAAITALTDRLAESLSFPPLTALSPDSRQLSAEQPYYQLLLTFLFPILLSAEQKLAIGRAFLAAEQNNLYLNKAAALLALLSPPAADTSADLMYDIVSGSVLFKELQLWKFIGSELYPYPEANRPRDLQRQVKQIYGGCLDKRQLAEFVEYLGRILISYNLKAAAYTLHVYTGFYRRPELKSIIDRSLMIVYDRQSVNIVDDIRAADVIISDVTHALPHKDHFLLSDINDMGVWKELGNFIQERIHQKWSF